MMPDIDIWAEEHAPIVSPVARLYSLRIPGEMNRRTSIGANVYVEVDGVGVITLNSATYWFGVEVYPHTRDNHETIMGIYDWLVEWEYAKWEDIGPEDRELFATEKLTNATKSHSPSS